MAASVGCSFQIVSSHYYCFSPKGFELNLGKSTVCMVWFHLADKRLWNGWEKQTGDIW